MEAVVWMGRSWVGKATKVHECKSVLCDTKTIIEGEVYCQVVFKNKGGWFYHQLHLECWQDFIGQKYQETMAWKLEHRAVPLKKTLVGVPEDVKLKRRRTLQYISRHKTRAMEALARNDGYHYELHLRYIMSLSWELSNEVTPGIRVTSIQYHRLPLELPHWDEIKTRAVMGSIDDLPRFNLPLQGVQQELAASIPQQE